MPNTLIQWTECQGSVCHVEKHVNLLNLSFKIHYQLRDSFLIVDILTDLNMKLLDPIIDNVTITHEKFSSELLSLLLVDPSTWKHATMQYYQSRTVNLTY